MKKVLVVITFIQLSILSFSADADLKYYQIGEDGRIVIHTSTAGNNGWSSKGYYSLEYLFNPKDSLNGTYFLNIYKDHVPSSVYFPPMGKALLKTCKNKVIQLTGTGCKR